MCELHHTVYPNKILTFLPYKKSKMKFKMISLGLTFSKEFRILFFLLADPSWLSSDSLY